MKKIIAVVLSLVLSFCCVVYAFNDIDANNHELSKAIDTMTKFGILNGYEDGTFRPDNEITRAEFAKVIIETIMTNEVVSGDETRFNDVRESHWAKNYIYLSRKLGIVNGMTVDTFAPEANITYEQAIKMIVAALGYDKDASENGGWSEGYIKVANQLGITNGITYNKSDNATRADVVLMLNNALNIEYYVLFVSEEVIETKLSDMTLYEKHMNRLNSNASTGQDVNSSKNEVEEKPSTTENPEEEKPQSEEIKSDAQFTITDENGEEYDNADLIDESYAEDEEPEIPMQNSQELTDEDDASDYEFIPDDPSYIG